MKRFRTCVVSSTWIARPSKSDVSRLILTASSAPSERTERLPTVVLVTRFATARSFAGLRVRFPPRLTGSSRSSDASSNLTASSSLISSCSLACDSVLGSTFIYTYGSPRCNLWYSSLFRWLTTLLVLSLNPSSGSNLSKASLSLSSGLLAGGGSPVRDANRADFLAMAASRRRTTGEFQRREYITNGGCGRVESRRWGDQVKKSFSGSAAFLHLRLSSSDSGARFPRDASRFPRDLFALACDALACHRSVKYVRFTCVCCPRSICVCCLDRS